MKKKNPWEKVYDLVQDCKPNLVDMAATLETVAYIALDQMYSKMELTIPEFMDKDRRAG